MANQVKFFRGEKAKYDHLVKHLNAIYFATDTHELLMNNVGYGVDPLSSDILLLALTSVEWVSPTTLKFTRGTGDNVTSFLIVLPTASTDTQGLMTTALVVKLLGIQEGALVNVIENVTVDGATGIVTDKTLNIVGNFAKSADVYTKTDADSMVDSKIATALSSVYDYKGSVDTYEALPTNAEKGDVYNVASGHDLYPAGTNWAWDGEKWDALGGLVDLSEVEQGIADNKAAIEAEEERATGVEASLQSTIEGVRTDLGTKEDPLSSTGSAFARIAQLRSELDILAGDGNSIKDQIDAAINTLKGANFDAGTLGALEDALDREIERATGAEGLLSTAINDEKSRAEGVEATLKGRIDGHDTDISNLEEKNEELDSAILLNKTAIETLNGNNTTPGSVAKTVKDAVDAEATIRDAADKAMDERVKTLEGYFGEGEGTVEDLIADAIAVERQARIDADNVLLGNINTVSGNLEGEITRAKAAEKANADNISALQKTVSDNETDIEGKVSALDGRVTTNETNIGTNTQNISNNASAILALQNNTVNGIKISSNPVLDGSNIKVAKSPEGLITENSTIDNAIGIIEASIVWHEAE